ncbi:unnamed protein product [Prorocentrum cordatum]|uniref:Protein xylosyltransferase n=1 Tax=Prorocentrum cordatum TaxID=2364126 RepID=A0ABN9SE92_9DINO|nr:unnamed protein product [Polarella glacialis]
MHPFYRTPCLPQTSSSKPPMILRLLRGGVTPVLLCAAAAALACPRAALGLQLEGRQAPEAVSLGRQEFRLGGADELGALGTEHAGRGEEALEGRDAAGNCLADPSKSRWNKTTKGMWKVKISPFVQQPPGPVPRPGTRPKVAFLMFVKDTVLNPKLWLQWMRDARSSGLDFRLIIHAAWIHRPNGEYDPNQFSQKEFLEYVSPEWSATKWCNMWDAEWLLIQQALKDPDVTHIQILSQDSIPLKPMRYIYQALQDDPVTRMCADDYVYKPWPRAETWWVMRRGDVELFKQHEAQAKTWFRVECSEEEAWYYPLRARMERWGWEAAPVKDECVMFTDWAEGNHSCKAWASLVKQCPNGCRVTRSMPHTESATKHPAVFQSLSIAAFRELLASPFWFSRKFADGAISTPNRFAALLENYTANYTDPGLGYEESLGVATREDLVDLPDQVVPAAPDAVVPDTVATPAADAASDAVHEAAVPDAVVSDAVVPDAVATPAADAVAEAAPDAVLAGAPEAVPGAAPDAIAGAA